MAAARKALFAVRRSKFSRLGWILAGAVAIGAVSALAATGTHPHAHAPPGPNANDLVGPAAASGWG